MTFANPLSWWALALVLLGAVALAWVAYRRARVTRPRRALLSGVRLITLLVIVVLLMRPVARTDRADGMQAVVPVLVDVSRSMAIEDADGQRRIDRARELLESQILPALGGRFRPEVLAFGAGLAPATAASLTASAPRSDLTSALLDTTERFRGQTVAGIVVLSDGGDTSAADRRGAAATAPVFPIGIGTLTVGRDREVLSVTAAEAVLDDSRVDLAASAVSHGHGVAPIELRLLENGRPIEVRRATPAAEGTPVREVFHVTASRDAPTVYTVEIPAAAGELVPENNSRSVLVQPPSRARRVLLVQGAPGFEHSFLRRALSGDRGLEVDSVVRQGKNDQGADTFYIQAGARSAQLGSGYPASRETLFAYDAVVLANMEGTYLGADHLESTRDFVGTRGGGLLVLGAQSFVRNGLVDTPLDDVLPLDVSDRGRGVLQASAGSARGANRVELTAAGEAHPIMQLTGALEETRKRWEAVPALASVSPLGGPRPGASVLAVTSGPGGVARALVAVQRYGSGRSMVFTGEASWRWRMMLPAKDRSYDTFWRQAVRWLGLPATDPISLTAPVTATPGEVVAWRVLARGADFAALRGATVDVRVTSPGGRIETLRAAAEDSSPADGVFVAKHRPDGAGVYRAVAEVEANGRTSTTSAVSLLVGGADSEMTDPRLNLRVLQRAAASSGGKVIQPTEVGALAEQLRAALPSALIASRTDLWHNGWSFSLIVVLLAIEWTLRRRWGLR